MILPPVYVVEKEPLQFSNSVHFFSYSVVYKLPYDLMTYEQLCIRAYGDCKRQDGLRTTAPDTHMHVVAPAS